MILTARGINKETLPTGRGLYSCRYTNTPYIPTHDHATTSAHPTTNPNSLPAPPSSNVLSTPEQARTHAPTPTDSNNAATKPTQANKKYPLIVTKSPAHQPTDAYDPIHSLTNPIDLNNPILYTPYPYPSRPNLLKRQHSRPRPLPLTSDPYNRGTTAHDDDQQS